MKARIVQDNCGYYTGEVYGTWTNSLLRTKWTGWNRVTCTRITKLGAKRELEKWKKKNYPDEFEI